MYTAIGVGVAVLADAGLAELDAPLDEELAERVGLRVHRLGMEDPRLVVGVER